MKLREYLSAHSLTEEQFGRKIGSSQAAVNRYCRDRIPTPDVMRKIIEVTEGKVTPNDFYSAQPANDGGAPTPNGNGAAA